MCAYMCVCVCARVHACMCVCKGACMCVYVHVCGQVYVRAHAHVCIIVCLSVKVSVNSVYLLCLAEFVHRLDKISWVMLTKWEWVVTTQHHIVLQQ